MCQQVYPKRASKCKAVKQADKKKVKSAQHTAHRLYLPTTQHYRSHVIVSCQDCHLFLAQFQRADVHRIDSYVNVPSHFCACGMRSEDLLAIQQQDNADVQAYGFARLFDRIGGAVRLAGGDKKDVKRVLECATEQRMLWLMQIWAILRERRERKIAELKAKVDADTYQVDSDEIAECMLHFQEAA